MWQRFGSLSETGGRIKGLDEEELWRLYRWTYYRLVEQADQQVGELLDMLTENGLDENTVVILTSDHGEQNGCHQLKFKNILYEESVRVPLIIRQAGTIPAGVFDEDHLVDIGIDLLPTVCDYAGIEKPAHCEGRSLRLVAESDSVSDWRDHLMLECQLGRGVVSKGWKYTRYENSPEHPEQLFDLNAKPLETQNQVSNPACSEQLQEGRRLFEAWMDRHEHPPLPRH